MLLMELNDEEIAVMTAILGEVSGEVQTNDCEDLTYYMYGKFLSVSNKDLTDKITCSSVQVVKGNLKK